MDLTYIIMRFTKPVYAYTIVFKAHHAALHPCDAIGVSYIDDGLYMQGHQCQESYERQLRSFPLPWMDCGIVLESHYIN